MFSVAPGDLTVCRYPGKVCLPSMVCITRDDICNGVHDCEDGTDEQYCCKYHHTYGTLSIGNHGNGGSLSSAQGQANVLRCINDY